VITVAADLAILLWKLRLQTPRIGDKP